MESMYDVIYGELLPICKRRIPFSLTLTFLMNKLMRRNIEGELLKHEFYLKDLLDVDKDCTVMDVGANIGQWTLWLAQRAKIVVALEPDPEAYRWLCRNVDRLENITPLRVAAWNEDTELALKMSRVSFMTSVVKGDDNSKHGIKAMTLDSIATKLNLAIDIVKLDVEGAELAVLEGSPIVLSTCRQVLVEVHRAEQKNELIDSLEESGFGVREVRERWLLASKAEAI